VSIRLNEISAAQHEFCRPNFRESAFTFHSALRDQLHRAAAAQALKQNVRKVEAFERLSVRARQPISLLASLF
jgi:hypothetical protein